MRLFVLTSFLCLASFTLVAGACNFKLGDDTEGEMGNLRFAYSGSGCFFGCALDRKVLQGAKVSVSVSGDTDGGYTATLDGAAAGISSQSETCTCSSGDKSTTHSRIVQGTQACESGESKKCTMSVEISAARQGFSKLKVLDPKGDVVDQVDIAVRPAARLELSVTVDDAVLDRKDGVYTLKVQQSAKLTTKAFDSDDDELYRSGTGVTYELGDKTILGARGDDFLFSGDETVGANAQGDTTVDVSAGGARTTARFHVSP